MPPPQAPSREAFLSLSLATALSHEDIDGGLASASSSIRSYQTKHMSGSATVATGKPSASKQHFKSYENKSSIGTTLTKISQGHST